MERSSTQPAGGNPPVQEGQEGKWAGGSREGVKGSTIPTAGGTPQREPLREGEEGGYEGTTGEMPTDAERQALHQPETTKAGT